MTQRFLSARRFLSLLPPASLRRETARRPAGQRRRLAAERLEPRWLLAGDAAGEIWNAGSLPPAPSADGDAEIEATLRLVTSPFAADHMSDEDFASYASVEAVPSDTTYYAEVWLRDRGTIRGITGGTVDLAFTTALADATAINHGGVFSLLTSGTIYDSSGLVDNMGGGTLNLGEGTTQWVRLVTTTFQSTGTGVATFTLGHDLSPGAYNTPLAEVGAGNIDWSLVPFDGTPATITTVAIPDAVYVDDSWAGTPPGTTPAPSDPPGLVFGINAFATIQEAVDHVAENGQVTVYGGSYGDALNVNKVLGSITIATNSFLPAESTVDVTGTVTVSVLAGAGFASDNGTVELVPSLGSPGQFDLRAQGTAADDSLAFTPGGAAHTIGLNGNRYRISASIVAAETVYLQGDAGYDTATVADSAGDDTASIVAGMAIVSGPGCSLVIESTEVIRLYATQGGLDTAAFSDGPGDDTLTTSPYGARLQGSGSDNYAEGFERTYAYATQGGVDTARLYDSAGDDLFSADGVANGVRFQGTGFDLYAESFEKTYGYATAGGEDTAKLFDSAGDDLFSADGVANGVRFQGTGFDLYAESFEKTYGYATAGGEDTAKLYDSAGDDTFTADGEANGARLQGGGIDLYAEAFEKIYAYATAGGADTAKLYDSAGDDLFSADGQANGVRLQGGGIDLYAEGFEKTYGYATVGGNDTARLYDSAGDDAFSTDGTANGARLQGGGIDLYAEGFEQNYAYATGGGSDTATMVDSAGNDTFTFDHPGGRFQGTGFDVYAEGFERYFAYATRGGYDRAYLHDTDGNDALFGRANWYELTTPYGQVRGEAFDYVQAVKDDGGSDTSDVDAVDYVFEQEGGWLSPLP